MKSIIICIGDELLTGDIANTNSKFMASLLSKNNIDVKKIITVGDGYQEIYRSLCDVPSDVDIILVSGGLGPTHDDVTKSVAVDFFETRLIFHKEYFQKIVDRFAKRGIKTSPENRTQSEIPENCEVIANDFGTALGMRFCKGQQKFYFFPGVPHEMEAMLRDKIIPQLNNHSVSEIKTKIIRTYGIGESTLSNKIQSWREANPDIKVGFYPRYTGNDIKLQYPLTGQENVEKLVDILGNLVYGFDDEKIEEVIGKLLLDYNKKIAVAESCTGGTVASRLTDVPGSSAYMMCGIVAYSNESKINILGVNPETLNRYGAVSQEVALEMAENVRKINKCDFGISTTGIAGPGGGSHEKPVGTMWCAVSTDNGIEAYLFNRNMNREINKIFFSQYIFKKLLEKLY